MEDTSREPSKIFWIHLWSMTAIWFRNFFWNRRVGLERKINVLMRILICLLACFLCSKSKYNLLGNSNPERGRVGQIVSNVRLGACEWARFGINWYLSLLRVERGWDNNNNMIGDFGVGNNMGWVDKYHSLNPKGIVRSEGSHWANFLWAWDFFVVLGMQGNYGWNDCGCSRWTERSLLNRGLSQCTQQNWPMKNIDYKGDFGYLRRNGPYLTDMVCRRNYHWACKYYLVIFHCLLVQWVWTSGWDTLQREVKGLVYQMQTPHVLVWFQAGVFGNFEMAVSKIQRLLRTQKCVDHNWLRWTNRVCSLFHDVQELSYYWKGMQGFNIEVCSWLVRYVGMVYQEEHHSYLHYVDYQYGQIKINKCQLIWDCCKVDFLFSQFERLNWVRRCSKTAYYVGQHLGIGWGYDYSVIDSMDGQTFGFCGDKRSCRLKEAKSLSCWPDVWPVRPERPVRLDVWTKRPVTWCPAWPERFAEVPARWLLGLVVSLRGATDQGRLKKVLYCWYKDYFYSNRLLGLCNTMGWAMKLHHFIFNGSHKWVCSWDHYACCGEAVDEYLLIEGWSGRIIGESWWTGVMNKRPNTGGAEAHLGCANGYSLAQDPRPMWVVEYICCGIVFALVMVGFCKMGMDSMGAGSKRTRGSLLSCGIIWSLMDILGLMHWVPRSLWNSRHQAILLISIGLYRSRPHSHLLRTAKAAAASRAMAPERVFDRDGDR
ncbi:hypothetical protein E3N88_14716 [Mikania micrantha]|uniref:Uncharacterized protein n=1 Tax=Mikania micrantha TaxID=192012 RepID=A0A5N6P4T3_9ASTR|nr:hypothetical protein E3N88_14716 [Mikania micrantha]